MSERAGAWGAAVLRIVLFLVFFFGLALFGSWLLASLGVALTGRASLIATLVSLAAAVAAGGVLLQRLDGRPFGALGFALNRPAVRESGLGTLLGVGGLAAAVVLMAVTGDLLYGGDDGNAALWLQVVAGDFALLAVAAAAEEALFRGYPFQVLTRWFGAVTATVVTSIAFALAHGANPSIGGFAMLNLFLAGVLLALAYLRTGSLWFATGVHVGWNWAMASLFDLPVSGLTYFDTPLYEPVVGAPAWYTGGAFGPEGGLVGTVGFGLILLLVLKWRAVRLAPKTRALRPLMLTEEEEIQHV